MPTHEQTAAPSAIDSQRGRLGHRRHAAVAPLQIGNQALQIGVVELLIAVNVADLQQFAVRKPESALVGSQIREGLHFRLQIGHVDVAVLIEVAQQQRRHGHHFAGA